MTDLTPNHLLSVNNLIGMTFVDKTSDSEFKFNTITADEIRVIARREGYKRIRTLNIFSIVASDYVICRLNVVVDRDCKIVKVYGG